MPWADTERRQRGQCQYLELSLDPRDLANQGLRKRKMSFNVLPLPKCHAFQYWGSVIHISSSNKSQFTWQLFEIFMKYTFVADAPERQA